MLGLPEKISNETKARVIPTVTLIEGRVRLQAFRCKTEQELTVVVDL
jgi:hypothetical protein